MDTFLGRNTRTCRAKVRRVARRREQKERTGGCGARVTESIVEAYWESANSPGFNLTGEPWTPFNIQAPHRSAPRELLQRNKHVKHLEAWCHSRTKERRKRKTKLSGFDISGVNVDFFRFARYPDTDSNGFRILFPYVLAFFSVFYFATSSFINILFKKKTNKIIMIVNFLYVIIFANSYRYHFNGLYNFLATFHVFHVIDH